MTSIRAMTSWIFKIRGVEIESTSNVGTWKPRYYIHATLSKIIAASITYDSPKYGGVLQLRAHYKSDQPNRATLTEPGAFSNRPFFKLLPALLSILAR